MPAKVKGKTQGFPAAGPDVVVQERLMSAAAVVVDAVVVLTVVVVETVVVVVVVVVVVLVVVAAVVVGNAVVVVAPGQVEEHTDSVPRIWVPFSWVLVEHQAEERRSVEAQEV